MSLKTLLFDPVMNAFVTFIGKVKWKPRHVISDATKETLAKMLADDYYIILTRRDNHLSTYFEEFAHCFLRCKWGYYSHALMNLEDVVNSKEDFRLVEATGTGVHWSTFDQVFGDISDVVLLKPKSMTVTEWTCALDKTKTELGKPYDTLLDITTDKAINCSELVMLALQASPDYKTDFANFDAMINDGPIKNLDPQSFYECPDFEIAFEARKGK